jgi:hypothetical protein
MICELVDFPVARARIDLRNLSVYYFLKPGDFLDARSLSCLFQQ